MFNYTWMKHYKYYVSPTQLILILSIYCPVALHETFISYIFPSNPFLTFATSKHSKEHIFLENKIKIAPIIKLKNKRKCFITVFKEKWFHIILDQARLK